MERKISLYVSNKNPLTWISAVLLLSSAVLRIIVDVPSPNTWGLVVLPVAATVL